MFSTVGLFAGRQQALLWYALAPLAVLALVLVAPALVRSGLPRRSARVGRWMRQARAGAARVRHGLIVFRRPRMGGAAVTMQFAAWALQLVSCYVLMVALGLDHRGADLGAAAAVLFAVNVSAVLPVTPSNVGVFQAACMAVLIGAYGIGAADALGYGIILQAVEVATAVVLGAPALVKEGLSWREVRMRAMHTAPVELSAAPRSAREARRRRGNPAPWRAARSCPGSSRSSSARARRRSTSRAPREPRSRASRPCRHAGRRRPSEAPVAAPGPAPRGCPRETLARFSAFEAWIRELPLGDFLAAVAIGEFIGSCSPV